MFARYHMYRSVYFHKAVLAAEVMVKLLFRRYKQLLDRKTTLASKTGIVPDAPKAVLTGFSSELSLDHFLALDDHTMSEFFHACSSAKDDVLSSLGRGLADRKLYKGIDVTDADGASAGDFASRA